MKILVIDDDQGLRRSLSLILEEGGHTVVLASDGKEGLAVAEDMKSAEGVLQASAPH